MNNATKYAAIAAAGLTVGFGAGYFVSVRNARKQIDDFSAKMIADLEEIQTGLTEKYNTAVDAMQRQTKTGPYETVESAGAMLLNEETVIDDEPQEDNHVPLFIDEYDIPDEDEPNPIRDIIQKFKENQNTDDDFAGVNFPETDDEDAREEVEAKVLTAPDFVTIRDPHGPYLISIDEYMDDDGGDSPFTKLEWTYFEGDDVLIDEREQIIPDLDKLMGRKNLDKWGQGTTDKNQMYIRNERLEADIEVTRDEQTYTRAILGIISEEEQARSMIKPGKMRESDDN